MHIWTSFILISIVLIFFVLICFEHFDNSIHSKIYYSHVYKLSLQIIFTNYLHVKSGVARGVMFAVEVIEEDGSSSVAKDFIRLRFRGQSFLLQ